MQFHQKHLTIVQQAAVAIVIAAASSLATAQAIGGVPVAKLGTLSVSQAEVDALLQAMPEAERAQVKGNRAVLENWLRQRLTSESVLREAQAKKWADRPEVKARIDAATKEITARIVSTTYLESVAQVPASYPSDVDLAAAYEQAKPSFNVPAIYRVAQIWLPTPADADAAAVAKVRDEAKLVAAQARQGDFAALAKARSQDTRSAANGGEVGALALDQMLPEMREPVAKLKVGEVTEPLQSDSGFHVVKLMDSRPARTATLAEVKPRLQQALREQRQQEMVRDYVAKVAPPANVTIDSAALDAALKKLN